MLSLPKPTLNQVVTGLVNKIVADATAGVSSLINTSLSPYGVSLDGATASPNDATELQFIKAGIRENIPNGLSVYVEAMKAESRWLTSPGGAEGDLSCLIIAVWDDVTTGTALTTKPHTLRAMFRDLTEALEIVCGPGNLAAASGGWDVLGDGTAILINPFIRTVEPCSDLIDDDENKDQLAYYCSLVFTGQRYTTNP